MLGAGLQFRQNRGDDRFNNPAKARRNHHNQENFRRAQSDVTASQSPPPSATLFRYVENQAESVEHTKAMVASDPITSSPLCNLERFLASVSPSVPAQYLSKTTMRGWRSCDVNFPPFFVLGDLWESFKEWSAYGAGVPLMMNDSATVVQYYVPFLSGIQLYVDPSKSSLRSRCLGEDSDGEYFKDSSSDGSSDYEHERGFVQCSREARSHHHPNNGLPMNQFSSKGHHLSVQEGFSSDEGESGIGQCSLLFEYLERDQPYGREPLTDKICDLACQFPQLKTIRSSDLHPSSWISVAWYPIYRIPMGPTLKDLDACFLTFHRLHTPITGAQCMSATTEANAHEIDGAQKISLPVFGLASYKFKSSLWIPRGGQKSQLANSLLQAANDWLNTRQVAHPDFLFFSRR